MVMFDLEAKQPMQIPEEFKNTIREYEGHQIK